MVIKVLPSKAKGEIVAPASKSVSHRALICAALSQESIVSGLAYSNDVIATINCIKVLGAEIEKINDNTLKIKGINFNKNIKNSVLSCGESGSTLRFFIPITLLFGANVTLNGTERLFERPLDVYEEIFKKQNIFYNKTKNDITLNGKLLPGEFNIKANISSQFISGLLFALPLLSGDSVINLIGDTQSLSYIHITLKVLEDFGIKIDFSGNKIFIKGNQKYQNSSYCIEGDYSNAAFLDAFNLLNGKVDVLGLKENSLQGDKVYKEIFLKLKQGFATVSLKDCPDLGPIFFTLAAYLNGAEFTDTARLRIKESDRVYAVKEELEKFGAQLICKENSVTVLKTELHKPTKILNSHNDHRIAMSLSVLLSVFGGEIDGAEAVKKSYPEFYNDIKKIGIEVV